MDIDIKILDEPLQIQSCIEWVMAPETGGINVFVGTVRNATKGKNVIRLEFEAYESMALSEMHKIAKDVFKKWPLQKVLIHHHPFNA